MPQINRVRVNNVKYNFGTQFYDDFMMRFSCKNTMYDLANGGGKSVLMLLLLQTGMHMYIQLLRVPLLILPKSLQGCPVHQKSLLQEHQWLW